MNKHILLVMKYLKDPKSVSQEELVENYKSAAVCASGTHYAANAADYDSAYAAYYAADDSSNAAADWVDVYFKRTGEDKQTYINELEKS